MSILALNGGEPIRIKPFPQWPVIGEHDTEFITEVLKGNAWYRGMGAGNTYIDEFEATWNKHHQLPFGFCVSNGTAALNIALQALELEPGSEILVTSYTYIASAFCILKAGLIPVFVDINEETYNIDPMKIEEAVTSKTKGIVLVHLGGCPVDFDSIMPIVKKYGLKVVEDCAHAHGAEWKGKPVGSFGELSCFSFHSAKNLTCGEGGYIGTTNEGLYQKCWKLHNMGRKKGGSWNEYYELGENQRLSNIVAALLCSQYFEFDRMQQIRQKNIEIMKQHLKEIPFLEPLKEDERVTSHGKHIFICRYKPEKFYNIPRYRFLAALQKEGIHCYSGYKVPLYRYAPLKNFYQECPVAEKACSKEAVWFEHSFFIGTREDVEDICNAIYKIRDNYQELVRKYHV